MGPSPSCHHRLDRALNHDHLTIYPEAMSPQSHEYNNAVKEILESRARSDKLLDQLDTFNKMFALGNKSANKAILAESMKLQEEYGYIWERIAELKHIRMRYEAR